MRERLKTEIALALKARDRERLSALRLISAALQERDLAGVRALSEPESEALLLNMVRQRREAQALYIKAGRGEQAAREAREIGVIEEFLPRQLSEAEIREQVALVVTEVGATGPKDLGKVMGVLKERYRGRMDFAKASAFAKGLLA
jgi:uncharacterized protein YqeY